MSQEKPVEYTVIGARLPSSLVAKLDKAAKADSRTRSKMLQLILEKVLENPLIKGQ